MNNRLPLNAGQQHAADEFFSFLMSDAKEMGIDGPGGVGKSFLMAHLIDEVIPKYEDMCNLMGIPPIYQEIEILAMTNKAAEVLAEATQRPVRTLHSFLNLKVVEDYETGATRVSKTPAWTVHEKKIIFVDEISMQDGPTDNFLQEGTHDCKIVYVGDDCQLKGMSGVNPVYQRPMKWVTLTEQMRTGIPEIQALHVQLRETVKTGIFKPIQIVPGIIDWYDPIQMEQAIQADFAAQTVDKRILCYTNNKVRGLNDFIRNMRQLPPSYTVGEKLINNNAIRLGRTMLATDAEVEIISLGEPYKKPVADVTMWLQDATLKSRSGQYYENVPLPMDRQHFSDLVAYFKRIKDWVPYFDLKGKYPDLRQRDAGTAYKAQGSTYDRCYIDLADISKCRNADQAARLLYVALSRERHQIILYGELAQKYGGLTM